MKYLISLDRDSKKLYFAVKERYGEKLEDRELFINDIVSRLKEPLSKFENIIIPESSNDFIYKVANKLGKNVILVKKTTKDDILKIVETLSFQKSEKESHLDRIIKMNGSFRIKEMKANQRKRYEEFLFEKTDVPENSVILDDSCFSGTTFRALEYATKCKKFFAIFSFNI